jgi:hypothetical protein
MSTRAVYTFIDKDSTFHVYKHHDGYPYGALRFIEKAKDYAFPLPRFEADEFAAAFIAANKVSKVSKQSVLEKKGDIEANQGGGIRLTNSYEGHRDLEFRYEISLVENKLYVTIFDINISDSGCSFDGAFDAGSLEDLLIKYVKE